MSCLPASEDKILASIDSHFAVSPACLELGRGDDCAILKSAGRQCVSSDLFLEDIHFRRSYFTAAEIGHKALAVNLSDLAAMGAKPLAFTLCMGLPDWVTEHWLDEFFNGMAKLAERSSIVLAGGDLSGADSLHISITVIGDCPENGSLLMRGGSMPGDSLFLIGRIGLSRIGLAELEQHGRNALDDWPDACAAHLRPEPQNNAALMLSRIAHKSRPPALMDVSDGLARDLPRLLARNEQGGLGARLQLPDSLLHSEVLHHAWKTGKDPGLCAFVGGEDYALLGACAPALAPVLHASVPDFHVIGEITGPGPVYCNGMDVSELKGFDHFGQKGNL